MFHMLKDLVQPHCFVLRELRMHASFLGSFELFDVAPGK